ncbi:TetR/AcrR family transcriptional regulator [Smaragdicoccus niigatensis]|uniref:TetR/AcrR family transcriptional regulator n=1 Tax=Smaragdicoccus niigatensis TaxID=359359 RepID=UPI0012DCCCEA|nr:TetR/AcrR family transcriptional regulator [Smaragdicoccus niigatensis]
MTRPGAPMPTLLQRAVGQALDVDATSDKESQVLDAALRVLARKGTREATMDDIAAESGVGRTTLFRRYGGKDQLFEQALGRAIRQLLTDLADSFTVVTDATEQCVVAFQTCMRLLDDILFGTDERHRADLIHALGHGEPSALQVGHSAVRTNIAKAQKAGRIPPGNPDAQADVLIHLMIGYLISPRSIIDLSDPDAVARLARTTIASVLLSPNMSATE